MPHNSSNRATRDYSRTSTAKGRARTRRADRAAKSARLFLAFAFPADMAALQA